MKRILAVLESWSESKWWLVVIGVKLAFFLFFTFSIQQQWEAWRIINYFGIIAGDTPGYTAPMLDFVHGEGYTSICRMPGLLPFYAPFLKIFEENTAYSAVIILQFILQCYSVILLARIAKKWMGTQTAYVLTILLYTFSTFVSLWDHFLIADSFSTSMVIYALYCFENYRSDREIKSLLWAGFWLGWSVFLRQVILIVFPFMGIGLILIHGRKWTQWLTAGIAFIAPLLILISIWTSYNFKRTGRFIPLIAPFHECYGYMPEQLIAVRSLIIAWGGDTQPWVNGSESQWLITERWDGLPPIKDSYLSSQCNLDSLIALKKNYSLFLFYKDGEQKNEVGRKVMASSDRFLKAFIAEHPFRYYALNRLKMVKQFIFPRRLDNMPGPESQNMNIAQKLIKLFGAFMLLFVTIMGTIGSFIWVMKKKWKGFVDAMIPWSIILSLSLVLGFVEQRYLVPAYPFLLIMTVVVLTSLLSRFMHYPEKNT